MKTIKLPQGARWDFGERQRRRDEEFAGLGMAVFLAIALIYTLLASQFESFIYPLIVLCSVPLCAPGVIVGLLLANQAFGLTAYVGVLMLVGIVVKNGILLVDYTNQLRGQGRPRDEAILHAAPTPIAPHPHDLALRDPGNAPPRHRPRQLVQAPSPIGDVGRRRPPHLDRPHPLRRALRLHFFDDLARRFRKDARDLASAVGVDPSIAATGGDPEQGPPLPPETVVGEAR